MSHHEKDCKCKHHRHGYHHHRGYSTIVKRTAEKVEIPLELLEVAEIKEGDFIEIKIRRVMKPSERKEHHKKHHHD